MLYGETLGPILEDIAQRLMKGIFPILEIPMDGRTIITFDTESRTAGTFEETAPVVSQVVGGPWMTPNEGRARMGLGPIEGGDELVKPLNLTQPGDHEPVEADPGDEDQPTEDDTADSGDPPPDEDNPDNDPKPKDGE